MVRCDFVMVILCVATILLQNYMEVMDGNPNVPPGLVGKESVIFGNIKEIYEFHQRYRQTNSDLSLFSTRFREKDDLIG
jgi:hypothetical protein